MALLSVGRRTHQFNVNISRLEKLHWWLITPRPSGTLLLRWSLRKKCIFAPVPRNAYISDGSSISKTGDTIHLQGGGGGVSPSYILANFL